jgi:hypothetical protein
MPPDAAQEDSKRFFFEKKKQKTFAKLARGVSTAGTKLLKFFLLLFCSQKRSAYFLLSPTQCPTSRT